MGQSDTANVISGRIFDIQRFSTRDGSGIRTTVFMKGCPLRCLWCQNPEGISEKTGLLYFENRCIHCGECLKQDISRAIKAGHGRLDFSEVGSTYWKRMIDACPAGALKTDSKNFTVPEVMDIVRSDKAFYRENGGITLSGGEPLLQPEFAKSLLEECQKEGIHTAVETSLYCGYDRIKTLLPYLDHIYADLKVYDSKDHLAWTGVSNAMILKNIKLLLHSDFRDKVIVRTPLIPKHTATARNIQEICTFLVSIYKDVRYELLNYNPLAAGKYKLIHRKYCFTKEVRAYAQEEMERFYQEARSSGIINLIMD